jgi:1,4-alpha-glucan branching enzyme
VAPFDAELFGHWWFEGPAFLEAVLQGGAAAGLGFVRLRDALANQPQLQVCRPSPSSWGQGGYHGYWLNRSNDWVVPRWHRAAMAMVAATRQWRGRGEGPERRLLRQAGRELLLAQASDWSFILRAGTTTDLARDRIERHLERFQRLLAGLPGPDQLPVDPTWLGAVEAEDALFPTIDPDDWAGEP